MTARDPVTQVLESLASDDLKDIVRHWDSVRRGRLMPGWSDIDPTVIARHLPIMWSWKYDRAQDSFTGRLAGETINAIFGKSLRNANMKEFFAEWNYQEIFQRHRRVVMEPCIALGRGVVFVHAKRYGTGERVILPLAQNGTEGDGIIGATIYEWGSASGSATASELKENVTYFPL